MPTWFWIVYAVGTVLIAVLLTAAHEASRSQGRPFAYHKAAVILTIWPAWVLYRVCLWASTFDAVPATPQPPRR